MSFAVQTPNRGASRATVRQAGELEALGEGVARCVKRTIDTSPAATLRIAIKSRFCPGPTSMGPLHRERSPNSPLIRISNRFAAAQWPTKKDEDRVHVSGGIPGLCDAVVQLYDGHGGKHAARHCILEMAAVVEECFFNFRDTRKYLEDRDTLYGKVDDTGFHPRLDDAVVAAFERLDREIRAEDDSGTTAAVIFLRKGAANVPGFASGDVIVKCAWVGDSRAVMFRDGDLNSVMDLSRDHKPECAKEVGRIRRLYNELEGHGSYSNQDEALDASVRGGRSPGKSSPAPGGSSAENSAKGGNKSGKKTPKGKDGKNQRKGVKVEKGLPEVEMTLGPSQVMEDLVDLDDDDPMWDSAAEKSQGKPPEGPGAYRSQLSVSNTSQSDSTRSGMALEGVTEDTMAELRARHADQYDGDTTDEEVDEEGNARRGRSIQRTDGTGIVDTDATHQAAEDAAEKARQMAEDLDNDEEVDMPAHDLPVFNRSNTNSEGSMEGSYGKARMSFVGFYKNDKGQALSKPRIFSSSGMSHGVSRSIGDRGAARGCVATPEITTHRVLQGGGARIVVCSDGVWDVFDSLKAMKAVKPCRSVDAAAKKLCTVAREKREFSGIALDDISTIVVDIGEYVPAAGDAPACACVVQ